MGFPFLSKVFEIIRDLFLSVWNLPFSDLGFSFGAFIAFFLVIKFVVSIFMGQSIQGVSGAFYGGVNEAVRTTGRLSVKGINKVRSSRKSSKKED